MSRETKAMQDDDVNGAAVLWLLDGEALWGKLGCAGCHGDAQASMKGVAARYPALVDGKLVNLEGDPDHVINQGALCSKGAAMQATHESDRRVKAPMYRAPGSDRWQEISWDEAFEKLARKVKEVRDSTWIATEKDGDVEYPVNRTDAIGFLGGAQNTNEECYLWNKMGRLFGASFVEHQARL